MLYFYDFNKLDDNTKAEYVWEHGVHVVHIKENGSTFSLYSTPDFYVEFELREDKIIKINAFKKGAFLERYISRVNLAHLINN